MGPDVDCLVVEAEEAPEAGEEPQTVLTVPRPDVGVRPPEQRYRGVDDILSVCCCDCGCYSATFVQNILNKNLLIEDIKGC